jgi:hypothetical protein
MTRCERSRSAVAAALGLAAALLVHAPAARAQGEDQAAARVLFEQGRSLMKAGRYAEACPKLEAARRLYISAGILLNLADCHEKIGRTASAWSEFGEAEAVAKRTNRDADADEAARRQTALEPKLARLTIGVAHAVPGLSIERDGAPLAPAAWGAPLPVDPGPHEIRAQAEGFETWSKSVEIAATGQAISLDVPELRPSAGAAGPPSAGATPAVTATATVAPPERSSVLPWALVGAGGAVAIGGGVLMLIEASHASDARANHDTAAWDAAKTPWTIGLVGVIAGLGSAAAGGALYALRGRETATAGTNVSLWWSGDSAGGLLVGGRW